MSSTNSRVHAAFDPSLTLTSTPTSDFLDRARPSLRVGRHVGRPPRLVLLMGVPGAGKSYVAAHLYHTCGFSVVSGESVTFALFQSDKCTTQQYATAYAVARGLTREQLTAGHDVVFDSSNVRQSFRQQLYDAVSDIECRVIGIFLRVSEERALERLSVRGVDQSDARDVTSICTPETLRSFYRGLEVPDREEPFVEVDADASDVLQRVEAVLHDEVPPSA